MTQRIFSSLDTQQRLHLCHQLPIANWPCQIAVSTCIQALHPAVGINTRAGDNDHVAGGKLRVGLEPGKHLKAIQPGHIHIQQNEVRLLSTRLRQRFFPVRCLNNGIPGSGHGAYHCLADERIVVGNQNFWLIVYHLVGLPLLKGTNSLCQPGYCR